MSIVGEVLIGVIYMAIVFSVVRPGSPAGAAVGQVSKALINVVGSVTGYTSTGGNPS